MSPDELFINISSLLSEAILDFDGEDRFRALQAINGLREKAKGCIPALIKSLNTPEHLDEKFHALGMIGKDAIVAEDALIAFLEKPNETKVDEEYVLQALSRIGSVKALPYYLKALEKASESSDPGLESIISSVFSNLRDRIKFVTPTIVEMYKSRKFRNKEPFVHVLLALHATFGLEALDQQLSKTKKKEDRRNLIYLMNSVGHFDEEFGRALEKLQKKTKQKDLRAAIQRRTAKMG